MKLFTVQLIDLKACLLFSLDSCDGDKEVAIQDAVQHKLVWPWFCGMSDEFCRVHVHHKC